MVGKLGTREFFTNTAVGDTVNLFQRLEGTAQPGLVLIAPATWSAWSDKKSMLTRWNLFWPRARFCR
jgi:class 3 adenylate cyclase